MRDRILTLLIALLIPIGALAQRVPTPQAPTPSELDGIVHLEGRPAPPGVLVLLDYASSQETAPFGAGELGRTVTDSAGRFRFSIGEGGPGGRRQLFAVTAHFAGYKDSVQVIDLSSMPRGHMDLDMRRDTSKEAPSVPPGGPAAVVTVHRPTSTEAEEELAKGRQLLIEKHDPKASIEKFKKAVKIDPSFATSYLLLGTAYVQLQNWNDARSAFEKASQLEPGNAEAFFGMGFTLNQQKDFAGAQKPLQRSLQLNPSSAESHYEAGRGLWALGKWQEAEVYARKAVALNKAFAPAHVLMGNINLRRRDAKAALAEFEEYLRLDPQGPFAESVKAMVEKIRKAEAQQ